MVHPLWSWVWSAHGYWRFVQTGCCVPGSGFGGGSLGLLLGVWTLQILMKPAISIMRAMPISSTAHQWAYMTRKGEILGMPLCYCSNRLSRRLRHQNTHHDPFGNIFVELCVEDGFLQSCQRPVSIHQSAPHEHVAVALELVAG